MFSRENHESTIELMLAKRLREDSHIIHISKDLLEPQPLNLRTQILLRVFSGVMYAIGGSFYLIRKLRNLV